MMCSQQCQERLKTMTLTCAILGHIMTLVVSSASATLIMN